MHFHDLWSGPMPLRVAMRNSWMSCSHFGHLFMSTPPGNGCVGASILPREAVGTQAQHAAQNRISLALANRYAVGTPLWHLFNNFYRHTVHKADCAENLHEEVTHG